MVQDTDTNPTREQRASSSRTRRSYLTLTGAGIGLAALTGISAAAAQSNDEEEEDDGGTVETEDGSGDASSVFDDLIDPVWGYPLAADESDAVSFEHVVEMGVEEGDASHPDFPVDPESGKIVPVESPFDPVGLHLTPGEIVQFRTAGDAEHTATAFHEKFGTPDDPEDTEGYLGKRTWHAPESEEVLVVYYWESLDALETFGAYSDHERAKQRWTEWYDAYEVAITEVIEVYGSGFGDDADPPV